MNIIGCKGKYDEWLTDDGLLLIEGWARDGLSNDQIAHNIGVSGRSFAAWIVRFPSISSALKKGKAPVDLEVENALLKRAKGYTTTETIEEITTSGQKDQNGNYIEKERHVRRVTKEVPPDVGAIVFWLSNRTRKTGKWSNMKYIAQEQTEAPDFTILDGIADRMKEKANGKTDGKITGK